MKKIIDALNNKLILNGKLPKKLRENPVLAYNTAIEMAISIVEKERKMIGNFLLERLNGKGDEI